MFENGCTSKHSASVIAGTKIKHFHRFGLKRGKPLTLGVVIIGRNEGERLIRCIQSVEGLPAVYVDSGSTDDSIAKATELGVTCVELDLSVPFTAARARNAGFEALLNAYPDLTLAQFVDGDCELNREWLANAPASFDSQPDLAVVCGRRREKFPERSVYNLMCDIEWNTPIGEAKACGGDAIYRVDVFKQVGGFDPSFIAGEEPELCFRIRQEGYKIHRLDMEMTLHDADIHAFDQWWNRHKRSGYAFTLNAFKHGRSTNERFNVGSVKSISLWSLVYLAFAITSLASMSITPIILLVVLIGLQVLRMTFTHPTQKKIYGVDAALKYSFFTMIGKVPQAMGVIKCWYEKQIGKQAKLIEYK